MIEYSAFLSLDRSIETQDTHWSAIHGLSACYFIYYTHLYYDLLYPLTS